MKIDAERIQDFFEKPSPKQFNHANAVANNDADASLRVDYAYLIDKATTITRTDTTAVRQAKELLLSGQLESPQNIRKTAEKIVKFGM